MTVPEDMRHYLSVFMRNTYLTHNDLDKFSLRFMLGYAKGSKRDRIEEYLKKLRDEDFAAASEFALNTYPDSDTDYRNLFARALRLNGFEAMYEMTSAAGSVHGEHG